MATRTDELFRRYGPAYKWFATATVMLGTLSMTLATTIVNVAIPDVMTAFGMAQSQAQWLSTGFLAAMTACMLLSAWALSAFGMRAAFIGAMVVFILAATAGGLSISSDMVIVSRVLQGAMAGVIQPLAMTVIFQVFPPRQRGLGMGIYGFGVILGPAVGPVLGGLLVDWYSWRAVFFLPLPTCALGIAFACLFAPGREDAGRRPSFDGRGFALLVAFLVALLWATSNGQRLGWSSPLILTLLGVAGAALAGFIAWQLRAREPLINVRMFRIPGFAAGSVVGFCFGAALFGTTYLIPLFAQEIQQFTAAESGFLLMPAGLFMAATFPLAGHLSDRLRPDVPIGAGLVLIAVSCFALGAAVATTAFWVLAGWIILGRVGMGLGLPAINTGSLRSLDFSLVSQGAGAVNFSRQLGGALGVNALSVLLDRRTWFHTGGGDGRAAVEAMLPGPVPGAWPGFAADQLEPATMRLFIELAYLEGYTRGFQDSFFALGVVFLLALLPAWLMGRFVRQ